MGEPDIFYILGNRVRRDLLSHLTCTECYFSFLSSKVSVSSTAVAKHLKIMEREGILRSYEREGPFIGPARKYYDIAISKTYLVTLTPNIFWYKSLDLSPKQVEEGPLPGLIEDFLELSDELKALLERMAEVESTRDSLMAKIKEKYLKEVGDMTELAILHYLLLNGSATVDELSDRLNIKEREVLLKARELDRFVPLRIKDDKIEIDRERLKQRIGGETDAGED
ncbi:transcriptional regulator [Thermococcus sp.]|uniref:sulfur metabolism transcriptional regulator SurR n=1 Tax=Thermococcus sp. TaxID=35749 RepID=UPI00262ECB51|nr:transcriptional regulator [Thermococcus sp.]